MNVTDAQPTPNPNAMKYVFDAQVTSQPLSFFNPESAKDHVLASKLFSIPGVSSLLLLGDFITVNKHPDAKWPEVTKHVKKFVKGE